MKKGWIAALLGVMMLTGCGAQETYETVADDMVEAVMAEPREIWVALPEESVLPAMESENGKIYMCRDYDVTIQTLEGGDLDRTIRTVSGYGSEELTVIQSGSGEIDKYEFVWTSAGEDGDILSRATILDDGSYHYVLTATIDAELISEYQEIWNGMFESFSLVSY